MKPNIRAKLSATAIILVLLVPTAAWAQHKHTANKENWAWPA